MKYLIGIVLFLGITAQSFGQADAISRYFEKYMDDESFTVVYISPKMFNMIAKLGGDEIEPEIKEIIQDLKGLRILVNEDTLQGMKYYKEATRTINTKGYEELMTVRDKQTRVRFMIKDKGDIVEELLLLVGEPSQFVMLSFVGKIDLDKISKLSDMNVGGLEHLDKIKKQE